jgi:hypothetical protein
MVCWNVLRDILERLPLRHARFRCPLVHLFDANIKQHRRTPSHVAES